MLVKNVQIVQVRVRVRVFMIKKLFVDSARVNFMPKSTNQFEMLASMCGAA